MASWNDIPVEKTPKGVKIGIKGIYYYPHADQRQGHGHVLGTNGANVPYGDTLSFYEGVTGLLKRAERMR